MSNPLANLSVKQLMKAIKLRERIDSLVEELKDVVGMTLPVPFGDEPKKRKGMSAAGRARVCSGSKDPLGEGEREEDRPVACEAQKNERRLEVQDWRGGQASVGEGKGGRENKVVRFANFI